MAFTIIIQQKGNIPLAYIAAHLSKIHGLDWSPDKESYFVTASNDNTVKVRCSFFSLKVIHRERRYNDIGIVLIAAIGECRYF